MRVSRFTQTSLAAIALISAMGVGVLGGVNLRVSDTIAASTPLELLSQDISNDSSSDRSSGRSRPGQLLKSLNLSRPQKQQLFSIRDQYQSKIRRHRQALRSQKAQLRQLMTSDVPASEVTAQFENVQNSRNALNEVNFESYLKIREVLSLEQRQIFAQQLQARRQSRQR